MEDSSFTSPTVSPDKRPGPHTDPSSSLLHAREEAYKAGQTHEQLLTALNKRKCSICHSPLSPDQVKCERCKRTRCTNHECYRMADNGGECYNCIYPCNAVSLKSVKLVSPEECECA